MHPLPILLLIASASASTTLTLRRSSGIPLAGLEKRQDTCVSVPAPATCERSCGPGNIQCIRFPNCYNPSAGETCCSNGRYCPANYYCTDAGCCPTGTPLEECGATESLNVIPPPATEPTPAPSGDSSGAPPAETSTPESATTTEYTNETPQVTVNAARALDVGLSFFGGLGGLGLLLGFL